MTTVAPELTPRPASLPLGRPVSSALAREESAGALGALPAENETSRFAPDRPLAIALPPCGQDLTRHRSPNLPEPGGRGGVGLRGGTLASRCAASVDPAAVRRSDEISEARAAVQAAMLAPPSALARALAEVDYREPNIFEIIWNWIRSLFEVVDPYESVRHQVEALLGDARTAAAFLAQYSPEGQPFDRARLERDVTRLLDLAHPELSAERRAELAPILANHARIVATNLMNRPAGESPDGLPTRPLTVEATPYPQRDVQVDGMRLRYIDVGPTEPGPCRGTIVLVHGHGSSIEEFNEMMPMLARNYRVLAMDLPGMGYSEQPDRDYSLEFYEDTVLHFMDAMGVDQATVAGGSLGGNMALRLGRRAPERFPTVVSWSPAGVWPAGSHDTLAWAAENLISGVFYWPMLRYQSDHWYDSDMPGRDEMVRAAMRYRQEVDSPIFRRATAQIAAAQLRESHRGLGHLNTQPTLIMAGGHDTGLGLGANAIEFAEELPDHELVVFPEGGHSLHSESPDEVARNILDFLARHEGEAPTARGSAAEP